MQMMRNCSIKLLVVTAGVLVVSCNNPGAPSPKPTSTPPPPPPPVQTFVTFSGTVYELSESGARQPVPNLRLRVLAGAPTHGGALGGTSLPDVVTDGSGKYTVSNAPAGAVYFQTAASEQHRFLCEWFAVLATPTFAFGDLPVVHKSWSATKPPPGFWVAGGSVHGVVSESINGMPQPLAGATVEFKFENADPEATTASNGFYMICSLLGADQQRMVEASKSGYQSQTQQIIGGWVAEANFLLSKQ